MLNTLLFVHLILALLLVAVILLQKTSTDGLSGIGGGGNNMGVMSGRSAANFLTKTTIILAVVFFANALILANLSTKKHTDISVKLEKNATEEPESANDKPSEANSVPIQ